MVTCSGSRSRPKAELEAAKAERRWFEEAARMEARESAPKISWGRLTGSRATLGRRPTLTSCGYRGARETGQAPCYAVVRTVSPVRVHSPVRYNVVNVGLIKCGSCRAH